VTNLYIVLATTLLDIPKAFFLTVFKILIRPRKFASTIKTSNRHVTRSVKYLGRCIVLCIFIVTIHHYILKIPSLQYSINIVLPLVAIAGLYLFPFSFWVANCSSETIRKSFISFAYISGTLSFLGLIMSSGLDIYNLHNIIFTHTTTCPDREITCLLKNYGTIQYQYYMRIHNTLVPLQGWLIVFYCFTYIKTQCDVAWYKILFAILIWGSLNFKLITTPAIHLTRILQLSGF
jgi:hypothetical protein